MAIEIKEYEGFKPKKNIKSNPNKTVKTPKPSKPKK